MNLPAILILLVLTVAFVLLVIALALVSWIAAGAPDVNGDPERDAGWTDHEIEEMSRTWDHGSAETERRPNLEYARRRNRDEMHRSIQP